MAGDTKESEIVKSLRNVPGRTLLLFGNKGSGKHALCNKLAGRQVFNESDFIEKSHETTFLCIGQKGSEDEKISLINTPDLDPNDKEGNTKVIANVLAKIKTGYFYGMKEQCPQKIVLFIRIASRIIKSW